MTAYTEEEFQRTESWAPAPPAHAHARAHAPPPLRACACQREVRGLRRQPADWHETSGVCYPNKVIRTRFFVIHLYYCLCVLHFAIFFPFPQSGAQLNEANYSYSPNTQETDVSKSPKHFTTSSLIHVHFLYLVRMLFLLILNTNTLTLKANSYQHFHLYLPHIFMWTNSINRYRNKESL